MSGWFSLSVDWDEQTNRPIYTEIIFLISKFLYFTSTIFAVFLQVAEY